MPTPCLEIVIFKVKNIDNARIARRIAQDTVKHYDGFISWSAYEAKEEIGHFADLVMWRDLKAAKAAAEKVVKDPDFAAVMAEIDGLVSMAHYQLDRIVDVETSNAVAA
ncbi:MAG: hypothetical protein ABJL55_11340 [Roseibium sp.]